MAMTDKEILSAAARLRAAKRRLVAKTCEVCGTPFEGIVTRRYCSDRCRVQASRRRGDEVTTSEQKARQEAMMAESRRSLADVGMERREGEDLVDYLLRLRTLVWGDTVLDTDAVELLRQSREERTAQLEGAAREERRATIERLFKRRDEISGGRVLADDSTEILRAEREARSQHLADQ